MEDHNLVRHLKEEPRDARWLMRKVGTDYRDRLADLARQGFDVCTGFGFCDGSRAHWWIPTVRGGKKRDRTLGEIDIHDVRQV